ncbi:Arc family DNA-binding protein [Paracandidimonas lactea]|uniref:Arc family DNA-binding protein n=1 Tax=Paracandidimonas lactea TaxID=2895524 RepID=UPI001F02A5B2|nr:Arc family DNA-binding protein [Paracandidimonas lactea]
MDKKEAPEKLDVRLPGDLRDRLKERAKRENRSSNAQAVHYIEAGLNGMDAEELARRIASMDAKLDELLRRLDGRRG